MRKALLAFVLLASSPISAALPPLAQSSREIKAILESRELYQILGGAEPIEQIARTENGYLVVTAHKELLVDIHYVASNKIGPREFELYFHPAVVE
jgi:hypothetical protein